MVLLTIWPPCRHPLPVCRTGFVLVLFYAAAVEQLCLRRFYCSSTVQARFLGVRSGFKPLRTVRGSLCSLSVCLCITRYTELCRSCAAVCLINETKTEVNFPLSEIQQIIEALGCAVGIGAGAGLAAVAAGSVRAAALPFLQECLKLAF